MADGPFFVPPCTYYTFGEKFTNFNEFYNEYERTELRNNYTKTDRTTSLPTARVECWIMTIEKQEVTLKTGPNRLLL